MKTEFIPYEQALELKELSFDEWCYNVYEKDGKLCNTYESTRWQHENPKLIIKAPLFQQAFRWFREKGFHCAIMPKITPSNSVVYYMYEGKPKKNWDNCFETYEEAELACLNKLIEIVKNEKQ
jgi:hypothetical protein